MRFFLIVLVLFLTGQPAFAQTPVLTKAAVYLPVLQTKINNYWPELTMPHIIAGQIEQESQWNPKATLKTSRELGRGLAQMTVTPKFNIYKEAVSMKALKGWDWQKDPYNPSNQLTFAVLTNRSNFKQVTKWFVNDTERFAGALIAYNAGMGTVLQRRALAIRQGKNNGKWFGGLENIRLPYEKRLLYGRDLGLTRNEYPVVIFKRAEKYRSYFAKKK